ncbi:c6 zinc finger domain [Trichoderma cornu-damae]|uniref:C6 zinc finger domain n=1 Tax=Trichoderma cornu-damae TaxID=654480 RepID=A0A9P8TXX9_9HYPO|nr:c6 zinc finger domain [Trichoderma cornu-damae]
MHQNRLRMEGNPSLHGAMHATNLRGPASPELEGLFPDARAPGGDKDQQQAGLGQPKPYPCIPDSTVFDPGFWQESVPVLVQSNVAVQSANLAVLILIFAQSAVGLGSNHYGKALWHYGRALQLVRETSTAQDSLRPAILCCMFFVIFEIMNGDTRAAEAHLWNGEKMLFELQRAEPRSRGAEGKLRQELPCALQFLMLQSDAPNLNFEKAGYLEAFIRMATSPDRVPNMVPRAYAEQIADGVEGLL